MEPQSFWRKCSSCKKSISFGAKYYSCSVSSCNGERTGYTFCSIPCFEVHLPGARHRDAAAIENLAPRTTESPQASARIPQRTIIKSPTAGTASPHSAPSAHKEVLIIASRLKDYIYARGEMNTSAQVMDILSDHIRIVADRAIDAARADGRKTVLDRDFSFLKKS